MATHESAETSATRRCALLGDAAEPLDQWRARREQRQAEAEHERRRDERTANAAAAHNGANLIATIDERVGAHWGLIDARIDEALAAYTGPMEEAVGGAIAEYGHGLKADAVRALTAAIDGLRSELAELDKKLAAGIERVQQKVMIEQIGLLQKLTAMRDAVDAVIGKARADLDATIDKAISTAATDLRAEFVAEIDALQVALEERGLRGPQGERGHVGKRGERGLRGERGERGPKGDAPLSPPLIKEWRIDQDRYIATPQMSDGRDGPPLDLRPLFERFMDETAR